MLLLLEEIRETESIYHDMNEQLLHLRNSPYLRELVEAIRAEALESLDELEWIKRDMVKVLQVALRTGGEVFKKLYTSVTQNLYAIKSRAIVLSQLTDIIILYNCLARNGSYRDSLTALERFVNSIRSHLKGEYSIGRRNLYALAEYSYSVISILRNRNTEVFCIPIYDLLKPWKWVLLLHEVGHELFTIKSEVFINEFRRRVLPLLRQLAPAEYENRADQLLKLWEWKWLKELIADLYGVALGGPSYTYAFMIEVFKSDPASPTPTHPSLDSRIYIQLRYLEGIAEVGGWLDKVRKLWRSYRESILVEELNYPFTTGILDELSTLFTGVVRNPLFLSYASEVSEVEERISRGHDVVADPLYLILALTLSQKRADMATQRNIIKTISEDYM